MKWVGLIMTLGLVNLAQAGAQMAMMEQAVPLENFEEYPLQSFPQEWKVRGSEDEARIVYHVSEEHGNHFLHAHAEKQSVQIGLTRTFQAQQFPLLQWRWRVKALPVGADERTVKTNDSAAGVYVVFDSTIVPRAIKYVWSSSLPVGTKMSSPVYWRAKVIVLESGATAAGEWKQETVNFYDDYKKLFGSEPGEVEGIALLTDSDTTESVAEADYDDFTLLPASAALEEPARGATALSSTPTMFRQYNKR
jgi:hypothetical protein